METIRYVRFPLKIQKLTVPFVIIIWFNGHFKIIDIFPEHKKNVWRVKEVLLKKNNEYESA